MFTRKNATAFLAAAFVAGAAIGSALPASAAGKHDAPTASNVTAHKPMTGAAVEQTRSSAPQVPSLQCSGTAIPMTATADLCSSYPDGHGDLCMWSFSGFTGSSARFLRNDAKWLSPWVPAERMPRRTTSTAPPRRGDQRPPHGACTSPTEAARGRRDER
jgi:hypothetical protein